MSNVTIEGVLLGSSIKTSNYDGKETSRLLIDLYQPESENQNKMTQLRTSDLNISNQLKGIEANTRVKVNARVGAYQNNPIFHFISFVK